MAQKNESYHTAAWKNAQPAPQASPTLAGQDCATAERLCDWPGPGGFTVPTNSGGFGTQEVFYGPGPMGQAPNSSCLATQEHRSAWYVFTVTQAGTLAFTITPTALSVDYDWAVWNITNGGCNVKSLSNQVACNYSGCFAGDGSTGMSSNPCAAGGMPCGSGGSSSCPAPLSAFEAWSAPVQLTAGQTYALLIDCFSENTTAGFNFKFTGTAQIAASAAFATTSTSCRSLTLTPAVAIAGATYVWNWGDNTSTTQGSGPATHTYAGTATSYPVMLTVTVPNCPAVSRQQTVTLPTPPPTPAFTARTGCGGVVSASLNAAATPGVTYTWYWGDNSPPDTGPGPFNHIYTSTGPFLVSVDATDSQGCQASTTQSVTPDLGGGCCPGGIPVARLLGSIGRLTTLSATTTYSGTYRVLGDLLLTNGTYTLTPGTVFYVDGRATKPTPFFEARRNVQGNTITLGAQGRLVLDGATLTASGAAPACPMWRGLVLNSSNQAPAGPQPRLTIDNGSRISHALCAVSVADDDHSGGATHYRILNSTFADNLTHVYDDSYHSGPVSLIEQCAFDSNPATMHRPFDQTSASDQYYTYEALRLTPQGIYGDDAIRVQENTIHHAVYGIVNNLIDRAGINIKVNELADIYQTGIWTVNNDEAVVPSGVGVAVGNTVRLSAARSLSTEQIDLNATLYGISGEADPRLGTRAYELNTVEGDHADDPGSYRPQVGLSIRYRTDATSNTLRNLSEGLVTAELDGSTLLDNRLEDCLDGLVSADAGSSNYKLKRLGCNTFIRNSSGAYLRGLVVQPNAPMSDVGDSGSPAGNRFEGLDAEIWNDGVAFTYHYILSSQEQLNNPQGSGQTYLVQEPNVSPLDYCKNNGAGNNGVNSYRGTTPSPGYYAALMDTVRRRLVPAARRQRYRQELLTYFDQGQQLGALEAWWQTLAVPNAEDYRSTGLYLLRAYDRQPAPAAAQRVATALQPAALLDADLAAHLRYRTVVRHLPQTAPRLSATDSVSLRGLALSGTGVAGPAARYLRYFHPKLRLLVAAPVLRPSTAATSTAARPAGATSTVLKAELGAAYPNPAQTQVTINCRLTQAGQAAGLRFTNLLTGQVVRTVPMEGTGTERSQLVPLDGLAPGLYAYQLLVNGQPVAAPRKLVVTF